MPTSSTATATTAEADGGAAVQAMLDEVTARVARLPVRHERQAAGLLRAALQDASSSLNGWLAMSPGAGERYTAQRHRVAMLQMRAGLEQLKTRLGTDMAGEFGVMDERARRSSAKNLRAEVVAGASSFGTGQPPRIETALAVDRGEQWRVKHYEASAARYGRQVAKDIRHQLAVGVTLGETFEELTARLQRLGGPRGLVSLRGQAGAPGAVVERIEEGLFKRYRHWAERLVRTEMIDAYNRHQVAQLAELNKTDPGYQLRWDSTADSRTCRICAGLHGKTIAIGGEFAIASARPTTRKHPPAHPRCRCAAVAWRPEWDQPLPEAEAKPAKVKKARAPAKSKAVRLMDMEAKQAAMAGDIKIAKQAANHSDEAHRERVQRLFGQMRTNMTGPEREAVHVQVDGLRIAREARVKAQATKRGRAKLAREDEKARQKIAKLQAKADKLAASALQMLARFKTKDTAEYLAHQLATASVSSNDQGEAAQRWVRARMALDRRSIDETRHHNPTTTDSTTVETLRPGIWGLHYTRTGAIKMDPAAAVNAQAFAKAFAESPERARAQLRRGGARRRASRKLSQDVRALQKRRGRLRNSIPEEHRMRARAGRAPSDASAALRRKVAQYHAVAQQTHDAVTRLDSMYADMSNDADVTLVKNAAGMRTLIHETLHGFGPSGVGSYHAAGTVVEEVTTEVLARAEMVTLFGTPRSEYSHGGAYGWWIDPFTDKVAELYEVSRPKARKILEKASETYKRDSDMKTESGPLMSGFVAGFPPTGSEDDVAQRRAQARDPSRPRTTVQYELETELERLAAVDP